MEGVKLIDDHTLEIHLSIPNHDFELDLAHPVASVLKTENAGLWDGFWSNDFDPQPSNPAEAPAIELYSDLLPVGAGPFRTDRLRFEQ